MNNSLKKNIYLDQKDYKKNIYLKVVDQKIFLHLFFNLDDEDDDLFYLFYDVLNWDFFTKWSLFRPYYLVFNFRFFETKKWLYVRLINIVNKNLSKNLIVYKKKNLVWTKWINNCSFLLKKFVKSFYVFKSEKFIFKFKQYYFFTFINNLKFFFRQLNFFNKNYFYVLNYPVKNNIIIYINYIFTVNLFFLKKSNKIFIFKNFLFNYWLPFLYNLNKINLINRLLYFFFDFKIKKNFLFIHKIEEKQKLKVYYFFIHYVIIGMELLVLKKLKFKKKFRRRNNEKKLKKLKNVENFKIRYKRRKRTNNKIIFEFLKKKFLKTRLLFNLIFLNSKYFFILKNLNIKKNYKKNNIIKNFIFFLQIKKIFFKKYFFNFNNKLNINLDIIYYNYLSKNKNTRYLLSFLNDDFSDLWKKPFEKKDEYFILKSVKLKNKLGNIKYFNKINIKNIYFSLIENKKKKKIIIFKNIISLINFIKHKNIVINNFDFIFNIYFWLVIFFNLLKKSIYFSIKKIENYNSFLNVVNILFLNKFNWFNLINFTINLFIIDFNNNRIKLNCVFNFLLQDFCLYFLKDIYKDYKINKFTNNVICKFNKLNSNNNIRYVFKGNICFENNELYCLNIIKKKSGISFFYYLIKNFFFNCNLSINFIKQNIKLYWSLLDLTFLTIDLYISNILSYFDIKNNFFYIRYKNIILLFSNYDNKLLLQYIIENFIIYFFFYFLKLYFFFCIIYDLNLDSFEFYNYKVYKKKQQIKLKPSSIYILNLFLFYNFLKKKKEKLIIKPANYLLNFSLIRIFNYFFNIWSEISYYFYFLKTKILIYFRKIIYKACFLTLFIKIKKQGKNLKFKKFKKKFKFNTNLGFFNINDKVLKDYYLKYNKLNFKIFLKK